MNMLQDLKTKLLDMNYENFSMQGVMNDIKYSLLHDMVGHGEMLQLELCRVGTPTVSLVLVRLVSQSLGFIDTDFYLSTPSIEFNM